MKNYESKLEHAENNYKVESVINLNSNNDKRRRSRSRTQFSTVQEANLKFLSGQTSRNNSLKKFNKDLETKSSANLLMTGPSQMVMA